MESTMTREVSSVTRTNMEAYMQTHDVSYIAEDAVFHNMATGEENRGREAIGEMLHYLYHIAFDAKAETVNTIITENSAMLEGYFTGTHIGEFAGIPATGKQVRVPLVVTYELENSMISSARVYFLVNVLF